MNSDKLQSVYNDIVGKNQEHIIIDYDSPFDVSEYENIFELNETLENLSDCGLDDDMLTALFKVNPDHEEVLEVIENGAFDIINVDDVSTGWNVSLDREEIFGMVLNEKGYNNLFSQPISEEMIGYMDFAQIYTCLCVRIANMGNSFREYKAGSATEEYHNCCNKAYDILDKIGKEKP